MADKGSPDEQIIRAVYALGCMAALAVVGVGFIIATIWKVWHG